MFHPRSSTIVACASRDDREGGHQKGVVESSFFEFSNDLVDSFGEDTSSKEEEVWRGTMIDTFVGMHSSAGRPDLIVNPVPEVVRRRARWKGIEGANPISRDLSKDWSVRTVKSSKQVVSGQRIDSFFFLSSVFRTDFQTFFVRREF